MKPIITSLLDTDLYKITQQQAVVQQFPRAPVAYRFINRGKTQFPAGFDEALLHQIEFMSQISSKMSLVI